MLKKDAERKKFTELIDQHFWEYYRLNKNVKPKFLKRRGHCEKAVRDFFRIIKDMLDETDYGVHIKDFGVIVPKDFIYYFDKNIFTKDFGVRNSYRFFFDNEYFNKQYWTYVKGRNRGRKDVIRTPKPHAIRLHRKKIKKDG